MQPRGNKITFEFKFKPRPGKTWPNIFILVNNYQIDTFEITSKDPSASVTVDFIRAPNNISIGYYNKYESETVVEDGKIVRDQSLELLSVYADDILLEPWFWTDHYYYPSYFQGYLRSNPDAPATQRSQLVWHFPGRYMIMNLPNSRDFWAWYQKERTERVLSTLVDPTGQIRDNHRAVSEEDHQLISEIKKCINV
jgi:hypothetical protein